MYWQKRFDRENPNKQLEDEITKIHIEHKDYGYRRVYRELRNRKIFVNKKKVCHPSKNGRRKASKNGMNRSLSFVFEIRPHLFHGSLDNEPLPT